MCKCLLECVCDEDGGRRWPFIDGRGDRVGTLGTRASALWWPPLWLKTSSLTHLLSLYAKKCCMAGGWTVEVVW